MVWTTPYIYRNVREGKFWIADAENFDVSPGRDDDPPGPSYIPLACGKGCITCKLHPCEHWESLALGRGPLMSQPPLRMPELYTGPPWDPRNSWFGADGPWCCENWDPFPGAEDAGTMSVYEWESLRQGVR